MAGDYIMSVSSTMLARIGNLRLIDIFANILDDLVSGLFHLKLIIVYYVPE